MAYDSTEETRKHIETVQRYLMEVISHLRQRVMEHDASKLLPPEKEAFDISTPKLAGLTYCSDEYKQALADLGPALKHHYEHNRHHPEHFERGIEGMTLIDLIEMFCDWKAATQRHNNGDLGRSIEHNAGRFDLSRQLIGILKATKNYMEW